jgi:hypothetical protein
MQRRFREVAARAIRQGIQAIVIGVLPFAVRDARAQIDTVRPPYGGRLIREATFSGDSTQKFAIYLPPDYDGRRPRPALFVLDPRGRGDFALSLFAPAAARLGYVILSAYGSASDRDEAPNVAAMNAMLGMAQSALAVDLNRLYIAGMSGTARVGAGFAAEARPHFAGIISSAAGMTSTSGFTKLFAGDSSFAVFLTTGIYDFNYREVRTFYSSLVTSRIPVRFVQGKAAHGWPTEEVCGQALEWLTLRSMLGGRQPVDSAFVAARLDGDLEAGRRLDMLGRWDDASALYQSVAVDAGRHIQGDSARAYARELLARRGMRDYLRRLNSELQREDESIRSALAYFGEVRHSASAPSPRDIGRELRLDELKKRAGGKDSVAAEASRRALEGINAFLSFYEPRAYLEAGKPDYALALLTAAETIRPLRGESCALLAQSLGSRLANKHVGEQCARPGRLPTE